MAENTSQLMGDLPLARDSNAWSTRLPQKTGQTGTSAASGNQRNQIYKWEADEHLGDQATIAMTLYSNKNFPNLKSEYPNWTGRIKRIAKYGNSYQTSGVSLMYNRQEKIEQQV